MQAIVRNALMLPLIAIVIACTGSPTAPSPVSSVPPAPAPVATFSATYTLDVGQVAAARTQQVETGPASQRRQARLIGRLTVSAAATVDHSCTGTVNEQAAAAALFEALQVTRPLDPNAPFVIDHLIDFPISIDEVVDQPFRANVRCVARVHALTGELITITDDADIVAAAAPPVRVPCVNTPTRHCINDRFVIEVDYTAPNGQTGAATVMAQRSSAAEAAFWFLNANNLETALKVLNGCATNRRFWVSFGGPTPWAHTIRVIDTRAGATKIYRIPAGQPTPAHEDRNALPTCD